MCFVHAYLLIFLLMVMIGRIEPGEVISKELCSGEDLEMEMTKRTANEISVYYNGKEIAKAINDSSMKWEESLNKSFSGRLSLKRSRNITVTLRNVSHSDTGLFQITTLSLEGIQKFQKWNVTVLVAPSIEGVFSISVSSVNGSCYRLNCGAFSSLGKPEVNFQWTVSDSKKQTVTVCGWHHCHCVVVGPATECLTTNLSAGFCISNPKRRSRRSIDADSEYMCDHTQWDDQSTDPKNPVPIVLGVLAAINVIAVITVIIVFYKRRSRNQREQEPPVHYRPAPMEDNQDV